MTDACFRSSARTDVGRKRKNNEDDFLEFPEMGVFVVADGMGGAAGGDVASEQVVTCIRKSFETADPDDLRTLEERAVALRDAVNLASSWIKRFADEKVIGQMGSTVVGFVLDPVNPRRAAVLHAGDSRLYRFRGKALSQLTTDHSALEYMATKLGKDPSTLPAKYQNELMRAVGLANSTEVEVSEVQVESHDLFILCSDGLTKMVPDAEVIRIVEHSGRTDPAILAQALIDAALKAGGSDNVTVVVVVFGDLSGYPAPSASSAMMLRKALANVGDDDAETRTVTFGGGAPVPDTRDSVNGITPVTDPSPSPEPKAPPQGSVERTPNPPGPDPVPRTPGPILPASESVQKPAAPESGPLQKKKPNGRKQFLAGVGALAALLVLGNFWIWSTRNQFKNHAGNEPDTVPIELNATNVTGLQAAARTNQAYESALKEGQAALVAKDWAKAIEQAAAALAARPADATATELRQQAIAGKAAAEAVRVAAAAADQTYGAALRSGQAALVAKDWAKALAKADEALAVRPDETAAKSLKQMATDGLARESEYEKLLQEGSAALGASNWAKGLELAEKALAHRPGDVSALALKKAATEGKAAADAAQTAAKAAEEKYGTALQNGRLALASKDWAKALEQADAALAVRPGDTAAMELKRQVTEGKAAAEAAQTAAKAAEEKYGTALRNGQASLAAKDWTKAMEQAEAALAVRPGDATATELKRQATEGRASALAQVEADQRYEAAVKAARTALDNKNWTEAERQADVALSLRSGDAAAQSLRQKAREGLSAAASANAAAISDGERQKLLTTLKLFKAWATGSNEEKVIDPNTKKEAKMLGAQPKANIDKLMNALKTLEGQFTKAQLLTPEIQHDLTEIENRLKARQL